MNMVVLLKKLQGNSLITFGKEQSSISMHVASSEKENSLFSVE